MKNSTMIGVVLIVLIVIVAVVAVVFLTMKSTATTTSGTTSVGVGSGSTTVVKVVAAENFWGSIVSQLGGGHVSVLSIVSDPNADPHSYESNTANAQAVADASFIIVNGAGYDDWMLQLISAGSNAHQTILNVQDMLNTTVTPGCAEMAYNGTRACVNPHFWYSPYYVNYTAHAIYSDLVSIDPQDQAYFEQNYQTLNASLYTSYMAREAQVKAQYANTPVASTESIFLYMANATGLNVISPQEFMKAVAEGNDPPAQDVATFENLINGGNSTVHVLIFNEQTVNPITQNIKSLAAQHEIPTIGVTETIQPPDVTFQFWQGSEVIDLQNALNAQALGQ